MDIADDSKYLLLDSRIIASAENTHLTLGPIAKEAQNPLFVEDKPWEVRFDNLYANVIFDSDEQIYKCWYNPFIVDAATSNTPREERTRVSYRPDKFREMGVSYATSDDGITWHKPALGIHNFEGSKQNNIVMRRIHGAGIFKDHHESDLSQRYKAFMQYGVATSPNGLHWSEVRQCPEIESRWDTHNNLFWDTRHSHYVGFTRLWDGRERIVGRTQSQDFQRWSKAEEVMRALPQEPHRQTYAMIVFPHANLYLGLVMMFDIQEDMVDCELAWSPDTIEWRRLCPGIPLIPRGLAGSFDSGCIYAAAYPITRNNELQLYYGGGNGPHTNWRDTGLGLARLRPDGFAGMEPSTSGKTALIVTHPLMCTGSTLQVSANAAQGVLRVSILNDESHSLEHCQPLTTDLNDGVVSWHQGSDLSPLRGKQVRLLFELQDAKLYAFRFH